MLHLTFPSCLFRFVGMKADRDGGWNIHHPLETKGSGIPYCRHPKENCMGCYHPQPRAWKVSEKAPGSGANEMERLVAFSRDLSRQSLQERMNMSGL